MIISLTKPILALGLAILAVSAPAAVITWGNAITITNDADISTTGNFEYGGYFAPSTATITINGVTFTGSGGSHNLGANVTTAFASGDVRACAKKRTSAGHSHHGCPLK